MYFYRKTKIHTYTKLNIKLRRKFILSLKIENSNIKNTSPGFSFEKQTKSHLLLKKKAEQKSAALRFGRRHFLWFVFLKRKEGKAMKKFFRLFLLL